MTSGTVYRYAEWPRRELVDLYGDEMLNELGKPNKGGRNGNQCEIHSTVAVWDLEDG